MSKNRHRKRHYEKRYEVKKSSTTIPYGLEIEKSKPENYSSLNEFSQTLSSDTKTSELTLLTEQIQTQLGLVRNETRPSSSRKDPKKFRNKERAQQIEVDSSQPAVNLKQNKGPIEKENVRNDWEKKDAIVKKKIKTDSHPTDMAKGCKNDQVSHPPGLKKSEAVSKSITKEEAPVKINEKNTRESQRKGLKNLGNTCFSNALFQCLFDVKKFRDSILTELKNKDSTSLLGKLFTLFENLQKRSDETQQAYKDFLETLFDRRKEFRIGDQGDSSVLLRALYEELAVEAGNEDVSYLRIFQGGGIIKSKECPDCQEKKIITESLKILDVRDMNFNAKGQEDFFQSKNELRACGGCKEKKSFICGYKITRLPEILIIKVHDTIGFDKRVRVLPRITLKTALQGEKDERVQSVKYGFIAGVMNELRGEKGYHSMDLNYKNGSYFLVDDHREVKKVNLGSVTSHPKLLFYRKLS